MKHAVWTTTLLVSCLMAPAEGDKARPRATPPASLSRLNAPVTEAMAAFQRSYEEEAAQHWDRALEALDALPSPQKAGYLAELRRGWLLYQAGRHADAVGAYGRAATLEKSSIEARVGALAPLLALRRWADVESGCRDVLQRDPANYLAGVRLAFAVFSVGRFAEAEELYRKTMLYYPSDADIRAGLAWSLLKLGKRNDARKAFLEALESAPRSQLALDGLKLLDG